MPKSGPKSYLLMPAIGHQCPILTPLCRLRCMSTPQSIEGGARLRTRKAILDAAMTVHRRQPCRIVGRHRCGRRRETQHAAPVLRRALRPRCMPYALHVHELSNAAIERAEPDCGPPVGPAARRRVPVRSPARSSSSSITIPTITADKELAATPGHGRRGDRRGARSGGHPGHHRTAVTGRGWSSGRC